MNRAPAVNGNRAGARLVFDLPSDLGVIERAVDQAVECCAPARIEERLLLFNFRVGLTEAIANAVLYGNGRDPAKRVTVALEVLLGEVRATVSDEGGGFDPAALPDPRLPENLGRPDGRGVFVMRRLMDEVRFNAAGNQVTLVLRSDPGGGDRSSTRSLIRAADTAPVGLSIPGYAPDDPVTHLLTALVARSAELACEAEAVKAHLKSAMEQIERRERDVTRERASRDVRLARAEMRLAHELQMKLLPTIPRVRGIEAAARVVPAASVGGDFYKVVRLSEGRVGVMIGDVAGHGFPAALIMALVMSAATVAAERGVSPPAVLQYLNRVIGDELESTEMHLSLVYCVIDAGGSEFTYSNAGHPHAFIVEGSGGARRLMATDPPMGCGEPNYQERTVRWTPEDETLLLFTDGLSDTLAERGRASGEDAVVETVGEHGSLPVARILDRLFDKAGHAVPSIPADDRTALILRARHPGTAVRPS